MVKSWTSSGEINTFSVFPQRSQPCPSWVAPEPHLNYSPFKGQVLHHSPS